MKKLYFWLFMWAGSKLFERLVITSKDTEEVDGILFSNSEELANKYSDIEWEK